MFGTMVGDHRSPPTPAMGARRGPGTLLRATARGLLLSIPVARAAAVDPVASYAPVAQLAEPPVVVVASASFGESTLAGVLERAKRTPGGVAYATSGVTLSK